MAVHDPVAHDAGLDAGLDPETVLYDGCEECEARADAGLNGLLRLDGRNLDKLWRRMLNERMRFTVTEEHQREWGGYRSDCERRLGETMYLIGVLEERRFGWESPWLPYRFAESGVLA